MSAAATHRLTPNVRALKTSGTVKDYQGVIVFGHKATPIVQKPARIAVSLSLTCDHSIERAWWDQWTEFTLFDLKRANFSRSVGDVVWVGSASFSSDVQPEHWKQTRIYLQDKAGNYYPSVTGFTPSRTGQHSLRTESSGADITSYEYYLSSRKVPAGMRVTDQTVNPSHYIRQLVGGYDWQPNGTAAMPSLYGYKMFRLQDRLFLVGGWNGTTHSNAIWYSEDRGRTWKQAANAPWSARRGFGLCRHSDGWIYLSGGYTGSAYLNDVWRTQNGFNWLPVTQATPFTARYLHQMVSFKGYLWIIDGYNGSNLNTRYRSVDGSTWTAVTFTGSAISARYGHSVCRFRSPTQGDSLIYMCGYDGSTYKNDIYLSQDGVAWTAVDQAKLWPAQFKARHYAALIYNEGRLYLSGGLDGSAVYDELWSSEDGLEWLKEPSGGGMRYDHQMVPTCEGMVIGPGRSSIPSAAVTYTTTPYRRNGGKQGLMTTGIMAKRIPLVKEYGLATPAQVTAESHTIEGVTPFRLKKKNKDNTACTSVVVKKSTTTAVLNTDYLVAVDGDGYTTIRRSDSTTLLTDGSTVTVDYYYSVQGPQQKTFQWDANQTRQGCIDEMAEYCHYLPWVRMERYLDQWVPCAYWIFEDDVDKEIVFPLYDDTLSPADPYAETSKILVYNDREHHPNRIEYYHEYDPETQVDVTKSVKVGCLNRVDMLAPVDYTNDLRESVNSVHVAGVYVPTGTWYHGYWQSDAVADGREIPREYYVESTDCYGTTDAERTAWCTNKAKELYDFFNSDNATYSVSFYDTPCFEDLQRVRFTGFPKIPDKWMRIVTVEHRVEEQHQITAIQFMNDQKWSNRKKIARLLGNQFAQMQSVLEDDFFVDLTKISVGTVQSISGTGANAYAIVRLEKDGTLVRCRLLNN